MRKTTAAQGSGETQMDTNNVNRVSGSPQPLGAVEDSCAESSLGGRLSDGPVVTMIACNLALLVMLAA